jgi:SHS2 domain-containing protein
VARVWTAPLLEVKTAPKAATWHGLSVRDVPGGLEATVVLDV